MKPPTNSANTMQQVEYLQNAKEAFMEKDVLATLVSFFAEPLSKSAAWVLLGICLLTITLTHFRERNDEDTEFIELVLTLFRNLLQIPDPQASRSVSDTRSNMHDALILAYQKYFMQSIIHYSNLYVYRDHILELLIILAGMLEERQNKAWNLLLLEIFYLILRKETAESIWEAYEQVCTPNHIFLVLIAVQSLKLKNGISSGNEMNGDSKLSKLMQREKLGKARTAVPSRHSKSTGVFMTTQVCCY